MTLVPLPASADNYIWMLQDGSRAIVMDPGDAKPVLDAFGSTRLQLAAILVTHHHDDYTGGAHASASDVFAALREWKKHFR